MTLDRKAVVVGGGLIGCFSALYLQRHGWNVTLLERDTVGSGASTGNCGYVCPSHVLPLSGPGVVLRTLPAMLKTGGALSIPPRLDPFLWKWLFKFFGECNAAKQAHAAQGRHALLASSMQLYREVVSEESLDCEWQDKGLLLVFKSQKEFDHYGHTATMLKQNFGLEVNPYPGSKLNEFEPTLKSGLSGGWYFPNDAHLRPDRLMAGLKQSIISRGGTVQEGVQVESLVIESGSLRRIVTNQGDFTTDMMVLATGAEAPKFAKPLGCNIPIVPGKGFSITMRGLDAQPQVPMIFEESHVAVTPMQNAFRVGSTMQFTGYDRSLNRDRLALLIRSTNEHLANPLPSDPGVEWTGWRPMVYDGLPCIDRTPAASNVIVAAGNGMIGVASAPATGKLVAEIASGSQPHINPAPYSLSRFL